MIRVYLLLLLFCCTIGCHTQRKGPSESKAVADTLSINYECFNNSDSTFLLCKSYQNQSPGKGIRQLEFKVIRSADSTLVYQDKLPYGEVQWINKSELLVERTLGYLNDHNAKEMYIVDLETLERRPVSDRYRKN